MTRGTEDPAADPAVDDSQRLTIGLPFWDVVDVSTSGRRLCEGAESSRPSRTPTHGFAPGTVIRWLSWAALAARRMLRRRTRLPELQEPGSAGPGDSPMPR